VRTVLVRYGYNVLEASNGGEALLICEQDRSPIHALLTDVVMPRMSGRRLAARLRSLRPELRVVYMSGYPDGSVVEHGLVDDLASYVQKPITTETLLTVLRNALDDGA
jgi:CheY-like chemotaxis protein